MFIPANLRDLVVCSAARLLIIGSALLGTAGAAAEQPLYTAAVEVTAQTASEERRALRVGLVEVLVKLSGQRDVEQSAAVRAALQAPRDYTSSFGFVVESGSTLRVEFSPPAIDQLLRSAGLPVWPAQRRPLLLWLQVDRLPLGRHWVDYNSDPDLIDLIGAVMASRGLPWRLPEFDLADRLAVADNRALLLDDQLLSAASERYQGDRPRWAALRLVTNSDGVARGHWLQAIDQQRHTGELTSETELAQWQQWLHASVDRLVAQEAYLPLRDNAELQLTVAGIGSMASYRALQAALATIEPLVAVELRALDSDQVALTAATESSRQQVLAALLNSGYFAEPAVVVDSAEGRPAGLAESADERPDAPIELLWRGRSE